MSFHKCENCGAGNAVKRTVCAFCQFPLGADPDKMAVCTGCDGWKPADELTEREDGWYCRACNECLANEDDEDEGTCPTCGGSGGGPRPFQCRTCHGTGQVKTEDDREREAVAAEMKADEMREMREG